MKSTAVVKLLVSLSHAAALLAALGVAAPAAISQGPSHACLGARERDRRALERAAAEHVRGRQGRQDRRGPRCRVAYPAGGHGDRSRGRLGDARLHRRARAFRRHRRGSHGPADGRHHRADHARRSISSTSISARPIVEAMRRCQRCLPRVIRSGPTCFRNSSRTSRRWET